MEESRPAESAQRLRAAMLAAGFSTPAQLSRAAGIHHRTIGTYLAHGVEDAAVQPYFRLTRTLRVSAWWVLSGQGTPTIRRILDPDRALLLDLYDRATPELRERLLREAARLVHDARPRP